MKEVGRELLVVEATAAEALFLGQDDDCDDVTAGHCFSIFLEDTALLPPPKRASCLDVTTLLKCDIMLCGFVSL